jgi:Domain of unknown function (DUF4232)
MDDRRIDALAKLFATSGSRRTLLKGAGAALGTTFLAGRRGTLAAGVPKQYVIAYSQAIAARRFQTAYALLGSTFHDNQSYDEFVAGFSDTAYVELNIGQSGPGPSNRYPIDVRVVAWHTDDSIHQFSGTYFVGFESGTPKIVDADLSEDPTPTDQPPLCRAADLGTAFRGDSATDNRFLTITFTNNGSAPCIVAGFPRVQVRDAAHARVISASGENGVTITTVRLAPTQQATLDLRWTNWCADQPSDPLSTLVTLPGHLGHLTVPAAPGVPPCLGSGSSHLTEKPFAPA